MRDLTHPRCRGPLTGELLRHLRELLKVVLSQAGWQVGFGKLVEESSAYRLIAGVRVSLPRLVVTLPSVYGCQQCFRDGTVGREFEHYGRLGLEYVELILVSQEGLSKFCIRERRDSPGAGSTHHRVWLVGSRSTCPRALAFWASNGHGYGSLRALVARLALSLPVVAWPSRARAPCIFLICHNISGQHFLPTQHAPESRGTYPCKCESSPRPRQLRAARSRRLQRLLEGAGAKTLCSVLPQQNLLYGRPQPPTYKEPCTVADGPAILGPGGDLEVP